MNNQYENEIKAASAKFEELLRGQLTRVEKINAAADFVDYKSLPCITIGVCGGDGIGPIITAAAEKVLSHLLADKLASGKVKFREIEGLTIENRVKHMQAIPDDVLAEIKSCDVILKGPTTTPRAGDPWPNIESANVKMRKELDLFANVRPVKVPDKGIDWTFFRENTEGSYAVGSQGVNVTDDLGVDFVVTTTEGTRRIARLAYEYARANGKDRVSIVTKANIIKTTDGKFLRLCKEMERSMGRTDEPRYAADGTRIYENRIIDIDILTYGELEVSTQDLVIPHPALYSRPYIGELLLTLRPL